MLAGQGLNESCEVCRACLTCVIYKPQQCGGLVPSWAVAPQGKES
jgi:hypothetical protein